MYQSTTSDSSPKRVIPAQAGIDSEVSGSPTGVGDDSDTGENNIALLYAAGRKWSLDYFDVIYARLGTKFWRNYFESEAGPVGLALVKEYLEKGIFKESDGAVIFPGEEYGLHSRVFINSLGLPTYEAKELGLAPTKYKDFPYDLSIILTGNEIKEYFKVLLKALSIINPDLASKTIHISHGMVRLPEGKMSSRTGNIRTGEWLLDEAKKRLGDAYPDMDDETREVVTVGAIKWALLKSGIGKDISFNIDESISFEGDSGPYIQYTYARTKSVVRKSEIRNPKSERDSGVLPPQNDVIPASFASPESLTLEPEELDLLKLLVRFDEIVEEAGRQFSPNTLTTYLFDLAQAFNLFYQKQRILDPNPDTTTKPVASSTPVIPEKAGIDTSRSPIGVGDDNTIGKYDNIRNLRLALTEATGSTLKQGLHLLGIQAPERM